MPGHRTWRSPRSRQGSPRGVISIYMAEGRPTRDSWSSAAAARPAPPSFACGFRDPSHFARLFKRVHGLTPRELVVRHRARGWPPRLTAAASPLRGPSGGPLQRGSSPAEGTRRELGGSQIHERPRHPPSDRPTSQSIRHLPSTSGGQASDVQHGMLESMPARDRLIRSRLNLP